jgi:hypothetical protein
MSTKKNLQFILPSNTLCQIKFKVCSMINNIDNIHIFSMLYVANKMSHNKMIYFLRRARCGRIYKSHFRRIFFLFRRSIDKTLPKYRIVEASRFQRNNKHEPEKFMIFETLAWMCIEVFALNIEIQNEKSFFYCRCDIMW